jgi:hypothetical protein
MSISPISNSEFIQQSSNHSSALRKNPSQDSNALNGDLSQISSSECRVSSCFDRALSEQGARDSVFRNSFSATQIMPSDEDYPSTCGELGDDDRTDLYENYLDAENLSDDDWNSPDGGKQNELNDGNTNIENCNLNESNPNKKILKELESFLLSESDSEDNHKV